MSISRQNLTVIIVTLKSEHIIDQCIQSINDDISIIVVENSNNKNFKDYIEKKYRNVSCILSNDNIGMGAGNNIGIENAKSDFVLILNPDVILFKNTIDELINEANNLIEFAIMSPISDFKIISFPVGKEIYLVTSLYFKTRSSRRIDFQILSCPR